MIQQNHKLLVVDDETTIRVALTQWLLRCGYDVVEAGDAEQALAEISKGGIDLILLDVLMPGTSGLDLLKLLRGVHGPSELPVIMATSLSDGPSIAGAFRLGANDYVIKPLDFRMVLARIRGHLERLESDREIRQREERYALASRSAEEGLWDWDVLSGRLYCCPKWKAMCGLGEEELSGSVEVWFSRVHPCDVKDLRDRIDQHCAQGRPFEPAFSAEYRLLHRDGTYRWMRANAHTVRGSGGRALRMTGSQTDVTKHKAFDPLTGLPNRLFLFERGAEAVASGVPCAVVAAGIDRFKIVNDSLGHLAGDALLVEVSRRLLLAANGGQGWSATVVARTGGDEFGILLTGTGEVQDAERVALRIMETFDQSVEVSGKEVFCTVSAGIAHGTPYSSIEDLLRDAATAMLEAKALGGARFAVFGEPMRRRLAERLEMETGLRRALDKRELAVHYQPKIDLRTGKLSGFEALVRWFHPVLGLIGPAHFIPVAEETGAILPIGEWVTREACRQMAAWHQRYSQDPPLTISVNLSVRQFRQPCLVETMERILKETGLTPSSLQLEITESVVMEDPETAIITVNRLKALGLGIQLDDFGTGYSSLSYLCRMPFDALKIDKSFILRMPDSPADIEIVRTVLALARSLGMEAIAEGVEVDSQMAHLRELGCEFAQGFCFGRPISPEETERLLDNPRATFGATVPDKGSSLWPGPKGPGRASTGS